MDDAVRLAIGIFVLVYSCILHECAHVWAAWKMGDPTGKERGRLTLNPLPHIDLFWTVLLPVLTYWVARFPIGGPKPAPVNPLNFRHPRAGLMWTALAGPATNILLMGVALGILWLLHQLAPGLVEAEGGRVSYNALFLYTAMFVNGVLAAINLIPVPPLDGSRFLQFILGPAGEHVLGWIERLGFIPIFIAFYFLSGYAIAPFYHGLRMVLELLFGVDYSSALSDTYFSR